MGSLGRFVFEGVLGIWILYMVLCVNFGSVSGLFNMGFDMYICKKYVVVLFYSIVVLCCLLLFMCFIKDFKFED